ncbi:MAG: tetratricopeptide repeat protein [Prosthecobacter sp.]
MSESPLGTAEELFDDASGHVALGELTEAIALYRRCVDLKPDYFDGWHALGMALLVMER